MLSILFIGLIVGAVMGLTGAGGGIIATPALIYALGWSMQQATPVALLAVTAGSALGVIHGLRHGLVRYRAALLMAAVGMPFTLAGVQVAHVLPQRGLLATFALVLVMVATRLLMTHNAGDNPDEGRIMAWINGATGRFAWTPRTAFAISAIGSTAGFTAGLLGVGGGFIIVPMLRRYTNAGMHVAVATSLLVISLVGSAGVASAVAHGAVIPLQLSGAFIAATLAGMLAGRQWSHKLSASTVQRGFALLLLLVATYLACKVAA